MNIVRTIRATEWWGYKVAPLLAVGYATALNSGKSLMEAAPYLLYLMLAMVLGAAYVSVINDITDMDEDLAIGKKNRMAGVRPSLRWIFPLLALVAGAVYLATFYPHWPIIALGAMPWLAFSAYSIPPVRLKQRGFLGVLADASGAHVFTSLFIVASMSYYTGQAIDWIWFGAVGVWALCYGLRGILWHQFVDRDNDIRTGVRTFATEVDPDSFDRPAGVILGFELVALGLMLWRIGKPLPVIFLVFYLLFVLACNRKLGFRIVVIRMPAGEGYPYLILFADYYQVFLPVALLLRAALAYQYDWIILLAHLVLFSWSIRRLLGYGLRIAMVPRF